jgi:uncharacterized zinc-type alcohol dehydrogenase-like protein
VFANLIISFQKHLQQKKNTKAYYHTMATIEKGTGTLCLCAFDKSAELKKHEFGRPAPGPDDIAIDNKFCGMYHSDLHACNGDWGMNMYPFTPGHEIAGIVSAVGANVKDFKVGDRAAVGCFVESCGTCDLCSEGHENYCPKVVQTYGTPFPEGKGDHFKEAVGHHTNGGYSDKIVVNQRFVFQIPESISMEDAGPLLCAGITVFSPLNRHILKKAGIGKGKKHVGVVGFGGLGHMAVKIAKAMGADVTVFSRSNKKEAQAHAMGASLLVHTDANSLSEQVRVFDCIIDTVSESHGVAPIMGTLKVGGTMVLLGAIGKPFELSAFPLLFNNHSIEGSLVGGIPETKEMLEFCAKHNIVPDSKVIHAKDAAAQFKAMSDGTSDADRYVIDISTLKDL